MNEQDIVVNLVALNGGQLIGRTRLQKQAYLLNRCGANFGLQFTYHYYGPYCFELAAGVEYALADEQIGTEERPGHHGVPYAVFTSVNQADESVALGELDADKARKLIKRIKQVTDIVLELAATIVFLRDEWDYYDKENVTPVEETKMRKTIKATPERIDLALDLLRDLGLWEQAEPARP